LRFIDLFARVCANYFVSFIDQVCDVNGWSFVKNSRKYYDDCSQILTEHMLAAVKPKCLKGFSTLDPLFTTSKNIDDDERSVASRHSSTLSRVARMLQSGEPNEEGVQDPSCLSPPRSDTTAATTLVDGAVPVREIPDNLTSEPASICHSSASSTEERMKPRRSSASVPGQHQEELRCVIAVVRHGDRTPKQKLKVNMTESLILKYFHDHSDDPQKDLKIKAKQPMTQFLVTVQTIVKLLDEERSKVSEEGSKKKVNKKLYNQLRHMRDVLERWKISGLNRKLQIKPRKWKEDDMTGLVECTEVQLILKWGGNLTKLGELQSIKLGQRLRHALYPDSPGGGILRLHSTFRHDLKIKTSDEGRVMKTAAAFAKGLLELEGEIPPILVSLVHKEKGSMHMLDPSGDKEVKLELDECKEKITANLQRDIDFREASEDDRRQMVGPPNLTSMRDALAEIGNPRQTLMEIVKTMRYLLEQLEEMLDMMGSGDEKRIEGGEGLKGDDEDDVALSGIKLYKGETLLELTERWRFIYKRLYDPDDDVFDLSRIPDVHDNVR
jgi:inositol hexakisphosphate/diphosphoinositol-pentakisphosphate kinase